MTRQIKSAGTSTPSGGGVDTAHRLDRVHDQVEKHLLQLNSIPFHVWQRLIELGPKNDVVTAHLALGERDDLENLAVDIEQLHVR